MTKDLVIQHDIPQITEQYDTLFILEEFLVNPTSSQKEQLINALKDQDIKKLYITNKIGRKITKAVYELIVEIVETCKNFQEVELRHLNHDDFEADTKKLGNALEKHSELQKMGYVGNYNKSEQKELLRSLSKNKKLKEFFWIENNIDDEDAKIIADLIENNQGLEKIVFEFKNIGSDSIKLIANSLEKLKNLKHVYFSDTFSEKQNNKEILLDGLSNKTKLLELDLNYCNIGLNKAQKIAKLIENNPNLKSLSLNNNNITDEGGRIIAEALKNLTELESLDLDVNQLGEKSAKSIAELIKNNPNLKHLNLDQNNITDEGARVIAEALKNVTKLESLVLRFNPIGVEGAEAITTSLSDNKNLKEEVTVLLPPAAQKRSTNDKTAKTLQKDDKTTHVSDINTKTQEEGLSKFVDLIVTKARDNKYLCSDKKHLDQLKSALLLCTKTNKNAKSTIEEMAKIGNTSEDQFDDKQKLLVKECVKILNQDYIKDIKHKNPIMQLAQMIWHIFAYIFYKADPLNDHNRGYQTIENRAPTNFVEQVAESRKQQAERAI